jgi:hypothetical protein
MMVVCHFIAYTPTKDIIYRIFKTFFATALVLELPVKINGSV